MGNVDPSLNTLRSLAAQANQCYLGPEIVKAIGAFKLGFFDAQTLSPVAITPLGNNTCALILAADPPAEVPVRFTDDTDKIILFYQHRATDEEKQSFCAASGNENHHCLLTLHLLHVTGKSSGNAFLSPTGISGTYAVI